MSSRTNTSTVDNERISQLERLIEADDWQGIVSTAGRFQSQDDTDQEEDDDDQKDHELRSKTSGTMVTSPASRGGTLSVGGTGYETPHSEATSTSSDYHDADTSSEMSDLDVGPKRVSAATMSAHGLFSAAKAAKGETSSSSDGGGPAAGGKRLKGPPTEEEKEALALADMWEGIAREAESKVDTSFTGSGTGSASGAGIATEWAIDRSLKTMSTGGSMASGEAEGSDKQGGGAFNESIAVSEHDIEPAPTLEEEV